MAKALNLQDRQLFDVMGLLGIDALADLDLCESEALARALEAERLSLAPGPLAGWVAEEYMASKNRLPSGWRMIKFPDGQFHYLNDVLKVDTLENPLVPRYRALVRFLQHCKLVNGDIDETTVLELLDPIEK